MAPRPASPPAHARAPVSVSTTDSLSVHITGRISAVTLQSGRLLLRTPAAQVIEVTLMSVTPVEIYGSAKPEDAAVLRIGDYVEVAGVASGPAQVTADAITVYPHFKGDRPGFIGHRTVSL